jgi:hypothetical protein
LEQELEQRQPARVGGESLESNGLHTEPSRESDFETDQVALPVNRREGGILTQSARMHRLPAV